MVQYNFVFRLQIFILINHCNTIEHLSVFHLLAIEQPIYHFQVFKWHDNIVGDTSSIVSLRAMTVLSHRVRCLTTA